MNTNTARQISPPLQFGRLWRAVQSAARARGYNGDPFCEDAPSLGSMAIEVAVLEVILDVPCALRAADEARAAQLARSIIFTSKSGVAF